MTPITLVKTVSEWPDTVRTVLGMGVQTLSRIELNPLSVEPGVAPLLGHSMLVLLLISRGA